MIRLDKILAHMGYGSRKEVKELIRKGYVSINGDIVKNDDYKVDELNDEIIIFDNNIKYDEFIYLMLNKPQGVVSATTDYNNSTVLDLIDGYEKRNLFPIGRLDIDTEGLLILTNDGELSHKLLSPKNHVSKTYYLEYEGKLNKNYEKMLEEGLLISEGYRCLPAKLNLLDENRAEIIITEGKFHQVKRMIEALGGNVTYLKRIKFKNLELDSNLKLGEYRKLTKEEIDKLREE